MNRNQYWMVILGWLILSLALGYAGFLIGLALIVIAFIVRHS